MARKLKTFAWTGSYPRGFEKPADLGHRVQARCVIAATSKAEAARLLGRLPGSRGYSTFLSSPYQSSLHETWNETECAVTLATPGVAFFQDDLNHAPGAKVYLVHPDFPEGV